MKPFVIHQLVKVLNEAVKEINDFYQHFSFPRPNLNVDTKS